MVIESVLPSTVDMGEVVGGDELEKISTEHLGTGEGVRSVVYVVCWLQGDEIAILSENGASVGAHVRQQGEGRDSVAGLVRVVEGSEVEVAEDVAVVDDKVAVALVEVMHKTS